MGRVGLIYIGRSLSSQMTYFNARYPHIAKIIATNHYVWTSVQVLGMIEYYTAVYNRHVQCARYSFTHKLIEQNQLQPGLSYYKTHKTVFVLYLFMYLLQPGLSYYKTHKTVFVLYLFMYLLQPGLSYYKTCTRLYLYCTFACTCY